MSDYDYDGLLEENFDDLYEGYDEDLYEEYEEGDEELEEGDMHEGDLEEMIDEMEDDLEEARQEIDRLRLECQEKDAMLLRAGMSVSLLRAANRLGEERYLHMLSEMPHRDEFTDVMQFNEWVEDYALEVFNEDFNAGSGEPLQESHQHQPHNMLTESYQQVPTPQQGNPLGAHGAAIIGNFQKSMGPSAL